MNSAPTLHDEACPEMDGLLHDYFQAEMPHPWPTFKAPREVQAKAGSLWSRYSGRAILASSVALLVAAYLMLGGFFPTPQGANAMKGELPDIGLRDKGPARTPQVQHDDETPRPIGHTNKSK